MKVKCLDGLDDRAGEEAEPKRVVHVVRAVLAVHAVAVEVVPAPDQVHRDVASTVHVHPGLAHRTVHPGAHPHAGVGGPESPAVDGPVVRHHDRHVLADPPEGPRQRAGHVRQPPDLGQRGDLRRDEDGLHDAQPTGH